MCYFLLASLVSDKEPRVAWVFPLWIKRPFCLTALTLGLLFIDISPWCILVRISLDLFCLQSIRPLEIVGLCILPNLRSFQLFSGAIFFFNLCFFSLFFPDSSDTNVRYLSQSHVFEGPLIVYRTHTALPTQVSHMFLSSSSCIHSFVPSILMIGHLLY